MSYIDFVSVNTKFKSSVNLQYDLYNEEKILQYVPTTDLCDVIEKYIDSICSGSNNSTLLAGPYGKGKSYLMLMITYLLSKRTNKGLFNKIASKIGKINKTLENKLRKIDEEGLAFLPVIINNSSDDIDKNFMVSLNNALKFAGLESVVPATSFNEAKDLLLNWQKNTDKNFDIENTCKNKLKMSVSQLYDLLDDYDPEAYKQFKELYHCVTRGSFFNPMVNDDVPSIYQDISFQIKKYGYTGIFTIFDEFGSFLENQTGSFSIRLNKIQSFSEKCNSSDMNYQMFFCCITHKEINLYNRDGSFFKDEFQKISGRFKEIRFDRSLDENYQILCSALEKRNGYDELVSDYIKNNVEYINKLHETNVFSTESQLNYIINNGFPINPIALYALIQVSEKVAQNERTLFTFVSDNDVNGFNFFINNNSEGLLDLSNIYDYFAQLIHDNNEYRKIYYKVETFSKLTAKIEEQKIFKAIAIINIINDRLKLNSSKEMLSLCFTDFDVEKTIDSLISRNILKPALTDGSIDFSIIPDKDINNLILETVRSKFDDKDLSKSLTYFDKNRYIVSHEYNFMHKMTRYYRCIYCEESVLFGLDNLNNLVDSIKEEFKEEFDGLVINLLSSDKSHSTNEIRELLQNSNIVVRYNRSPLSKEAKKKLKIIEACNYLISSKKLQNDSLIDNLRVLVEDYSNELQTYLDAYNKKSKLIVGYDVNNRSESYVLNKVLENYYDKTIILNNEQVNRHILSSTTAKSRSILLNDILNGSDSIENFSKTSAEATILHSFYNSLKDNEISIVKIIKNEINKNKGSKTNFKELIFKLKNAPYGMREGIIPFFLAKAIFELSIKTDKSIDTIIIYNDNKEIPLNSENLVRIVEEPSRYEFYYEVVNESKLNVLYKLCSIFNVKSINNFASDLNDLIIKIKHYVSNLKPIIIKSSIKENMLRLDINDIIFKDIFMKHDINYYDVIFNELPNRLNIRFESLPDVISDIQSDFDSKFEEFTNKNIKQLISMFKVSTDNIKTAYDMWKLNNKNIDNVIFETTEKKAYKKLNIIGYDNKEAINTISFEVLSSDLSDWTEKKKELFFNTIKSLVEKTENYIEKEDLSKKDFSVDDEKPLSTLGQTLFSNLEENLNEYGYALSNEEKATVLKKLLKQILD